MKKTSLFLLLVGLLIAFTTIDFKATHVSAQGETKRWVVIFHQPSGIPSDARTSVAASGGTVLTEMPEIGALAATSTNPNFPTEIAKNRKVAEVTEDIELRWIPTPEQMNAQAVDESQASAAGPTEPPGDDTQTGPDPFYNVFQWDKKRIRASNQGS